MVQMGAVAVTKGSLRVCGTVAECVHSEVRSS